MPTKPNLLFIWTDQQRSDTMACYGNRFVETPNLNALAERSTVFANAYVTQTVCTPSRSSVMTGLYPHTNGCTANNVSLDPGVQTIAEMISREYVRAYYGKWHLGDEIIPQHGFDHWVSIEDHYRPYYSDPAYLERFSSYHHYLLEQGFEPDVEREGAVVFSREAAARMPLEHTKTMFLGREAAQFLRRQDPRRPFMLNVNFLDPHNPHMGPFDTLNAPERIPTGPAFLRRPSPNGSAVNRHQAEYWTSVTYQGCDLRTEEGWRRLRAQYLGQVTLVDRAVGQILRALEESGLADDTIVVYTSDHGDMMGDHDVLAKNYQYEEAMRVPLLVRVPWLETTGHLIPGRVSQIDLVPTLLELTGEPVPEKLEGQSRAAVLRGEETLAGTDVFVEWSWSGRGCRRGYLADEDPTSDGYRLARSPWRTVITADGWKLNLSPVDRCELFDLSSDPHELANLYNDPAHKATIEDLSQRIYAWQQGTRDDVRLPMTPR